jgi:hypothetical protein
MHDMQMIESNNEATQQWTTPIHMMSQPTMTRKLNGWNLIRSLHDHMCRQSPRCHRHVADLFLFTLFHMFFLC